MAGFLRNDVLRCSEWEQWYFTNHCGVFKTTAINANFTLYRGRFKLLASLFIKKSLIDWSGHLYKNHQLV